MYSSCIFKITIGSQYLPLLFFMFLLIFGAPDLQASTFISSETCTLLAQVPAALWKTSPSWCDQQLILLTCIYIVQQEFRGYKAMPISAGHFQRQLKQWKIKKKCGLN